MLIQELCKYIVRMEGWFPGSVAWRNNNPGNLNTGPRCTGQDSNKHGIYNKVSEGYADLEDLVAGVIAKHPNVTMTTFFAGERDAQGKVIEGGYNGFAPAMDPRKPNDPITYAKFVATNLKVDPNVPLTTLV